MDVAFDFQQAEKAVQRGGSDAAQDAAPVFKKLDERLEEVSGCITKALALEDLPEDPAIFSDGTPIPMGVAIALCGILTAVTSITVVGQRRAL